MTWLFLRGGVEHLRCWVLPLELQKSKTNTHSKNKNKGTKKTETNNPTQNTFAYYDLAFPPMEMWLELGSFVSPDHVTES